MVVNTRKQHEEGEKNHKGKKKKNYRIENKSESLSKIEDVESHE